LAALPFAAFFRRAVEFPAKVNIAEMGQSDVVDGHHFEGTNEDSSRKTLFATTEHPSVAEYLPKSATQLDS
jgi:hypothetical protein